MGMVKCNGQGVRFIRGSEVSESQHFGDHEDHLLFDRGAVPCDTLLYLHRGVLVYLQSMGFAQEQNNSPYLTHLDETLAILKVEERFNNHHGRSLPPYDIIELCVYLPQFLGL